MIKKIIVSISVFILCLTPVFAISYPKQDTSIYVNDYADVLSEDTKQSLISINESCDHQTGGYVVVATFDFVEGDLYDYSYQLFNHWGVGDSHNNNGILIVLDIGNENCSWIIGTGLENTLSDSRCQSIINEYLKEDFLNKNYDQAILNTTKQFVKVIENGNFQVDDNQSGFFNFNLMEIIKTVFFILIILIIIVAAVLSPSRGRSSSRRYHRSHYHRPPPPHHRSHHHEPPPYHGPQHHAGGPRPGGFSGGPSRSRPSGGSLRSGPSRSGGSHHSGGKSRGAGGTLK